MVKSIERKIESKKAEFNKLKATLEENLAIRQQSDQNIGILRAQLQELNGAIKALEEIRAEPENTKEKENVESVD